MTMNASSPSTRQGAAAAAVLPQRKAPVLQPQRQPFRVLQTGRAPAQLSLFLRPSR